MRDGVRTIRAWGLRWWARLSDRPVGLVVVYHLVAQRSGDPERELVAPHSAELFQAHLRHLASRYRVVQADALLAAARDRRRGARVPVAVTFDDDLRSHVTLVAPLLEAAGLLATFYLTGAGLDGPKRFWWERLQSLWDAGDEAVRADLLARAGTTPDASLRTLGLTVENWPARRRAAFDAELAELAGDDPVDAGLRASDVRALVDAGHRVGFHTLRHDNLTTLTGEELVAALRDGRDALQAVVGAPLRTLAYPHGRANPVVAVAAAEAGFEAAFSTVATPVNPANDARRLGRYWPSYGPSALFALDLAQIAVRPGPDRL
jgi:peptidoglycan/xylan/chitin deacetylase (PgdA/CDA1 family)